MAHLHSSARALSSPSRCFQLSTKLDKDLFGCLCAERLEQFSPVSKGYQYHVFLSHSETLHCENEIPNRQGVLITQPIKSKSLFELIKESVIVTLLIISAVFTYFQLSL